MPITNELLTNPTIPYPNFENGKAMDDYLFDENNDAIVKKLLELVNEINNIKTSLLSSTYGDSGADNIGVSNIDGLNTDSLQITLEAIKNDINSIVFNNLPSSSITLDKLAFIPITEQEDFKQENLNNIYYNYVKITSPTSANNSSEGYKIGDRWTNTVDKTYWRCIGDGLWEADDTLNTAVATLYGLVGVNATVSNVLKRVVPINSYVQFCTSTSSTNLDMAFGKLNEDRVVGIGLQMAMYSWFKGDSKIEFPYTNLITKNTLDDCLNNAYSFMEIITNPILLELIDNSPYAKAKKDIRLNDTNIASQIRTLTGIAASYTTTASILSNNTAFDTVCKNYHASILFTYSPEPTLIALRENVTKLSIMANNIDSLNAFSISGYAKNILSQSTLRQQGYFTSESGQYKLIYNNKCLVVGGKKFSW